MRVQGLIVTAPQEVDRQQFQLGDPDPNTVVVRVTACGLCTWEQRVYRGAKATYPFWGGHELCGIVEHVGAGVSAAVKPGDLVAAALMDRCRSCRWCWTGLDNHCSYTHPRRPDHLPAGPRGLSTHMVLRPEKLVPLDPSLGLRRGALLEPLACVLRAIRRSGLKAGNLAVVIGMGTLGLLHAEALRAMGVEVVGCEPDAPDGLSLDVVKDAGGADAVFCTRGGAASIGAAVKACARGGTVVLFQSIPGCGSVALDANDIHYREIAVIGSIGQRMEDLWQAKMMVELNPALLDALNVELVPHDSPKEAFDRSLDHSVNRVLVTFD